MRAVIVGAGMGGLMTALALRQSDRSPYEVGPDSRAHAQTLRNTQVSSRAHMAWHFRSA